MAAQEFADAETETMSMREAIRTGLREELLADDSVFIMGQDEEDGGSFEVTAGLHDEFGDNRVRNTPISEAAQVGSGVGAAATGLRPVVNLSFSDFIGVCFDQIMNQAGKTRYMFGGASDVPLTLRAIEGAGVNAAAQHSGTVHTLVAHLPGIKAVAPGTPAAAKGLMKSAIRADDPVMFFENKTIYDRRGPVPTDEEFAVPLGEASVEQEGADVTVVATQRLLGESLRAARDLDDVSVEVIDPRSLYPLDTDTLADSIRKTGRLVVADESPMSYGLHAEIVTRVVENAFWSIDAPVQRVGVPDTPIPFTPSLEDEVIPDAEDVRRAIERTI
ncbi:alpha-ketoacid dehydrogenase subunit beta [Halorussus halobius]|uniref:alpha-ketoacid dehydrogenase subunit beta n=1 Tax=Halorussus halobius TaxID=1710537 RepID=UPI0010923933|nr:alpha-ketoacid dehydrogenase subunit beta [Halorussus halobius]